MQPIIYNRIELFMYIKFEDFVKNLPAEYNRRYLFKIIAKTTAPTDHTKDPTIPPSERIKRIYTKEEIAQNAPSLSWRAIDVNHNELPIPDAFVLYSQANSNFEVEAFCYIPNDEYAQKLRSGFIKNVSIEQHNWLDVPTADGVKQELLSFVGLALVEPPFHAGDPNTSIKPLYEGFSIRCEIVGIEEVKEEAFGDASFPDSSFAFLGLYHQTHNKSDRKLPYKNADGSVDLPHVRNALARLSQTQGIPPAEQASIKAMLEKILAGQKNEAVVEPVKEPVKDPAKPVEEPKKEPTKEELLAVVEKRVKELEETVTRMQKTTTDADKKAKEEFDKGKKEGKLEVIKNVEKVIPSVLVQRQGSIPLNRLVIELKKKLREESQ